MGPDTIWVFIPLTAITLGVGGSMVAAITKTILKSQERRLELRLRAQQGQTEEVSHHLAAMRAEIAALRDTTTQFDLTMDHQMQRMEQRLSRLETRAAAQTATTSDEPLQTVRPG